MDEYMRGNKCIRPNKMLLLQRKGILEKGLTLFDLNKFACPNITCSSLMSAYSILCLGYFFYTMCDFFV